MVALELLQELSKPLCVVCSNEECEISEIPN